MLTSEIDHVDKLLEKKKPLPADLVKLAKKYGIDLELVMKQRYVLIHILLYRRKSISSELERHDKLLVSVGLAKPKI